MWIKTYGKLLNKFNGVVFVELQEELTHKLLQGKRVSFNCEIRLKQQPGFCRLFQAFISVSV